MISTGDIFEDVKPEAEPKTDSYYRVISSDLEKNRPTSQYLRPYINFSSEGDTNVVSLKSISGDGKYCVFSRPGWYEDGNRNLRIIDLVVLADTEESARTEFERRKQESLEVKEHAQKWVEGSILPRLAEVEGIKGVIGRGDCYLKGRLPGIKSDVDLTLLVDFPSSDKHALQELRNRLIDVFGLDTNVQYMSLFVPITEAGLGGGSSETLVPASKQDLPDMSEPVRVSFDIISFTDLPKLVREASSDKITAIVNPYEAISFARGKVLLDKTDGALDDTVKLFEKKYTRKFVL